MTRIISGSEDTQLDQPPRSVLVRDWLQSLTADGWAALIALIALAWTVTSSLVDLLGRLFASVSVDLEPDEGPGQYRFLITNHGTRAAKSIGLGFELIPESAAEPIFIVSHREPFPIPALAPGQSVSVPTTLVLGVPSSFEVVVTWRDAKRRRNVVTLFR